MIDWSACRTPVGPFSTFSTLYPRQVPRPRLVVPARQTEARAERTLDVAQPVTASWRGVGRGFLPAPLPPGEGGFQGSALRVWGWVGSGRRQPGPPILMVDFCPTVGILPADSSPEMDFDLVHCKLNRDHVHQGFQHPEGDSAYDDSYRNFIGQTGFCLGFAWPCRPYWFVPFCFHQSFPNTCSLYRFTSSAVRVFKCFQISAPIMSLSFTSSFLSTISLIRRAFNASTRSSLNL